MLSAPTSTTSTLARSNVARSYPEFVRYLGRVYDLGDTEGIPPQDQFPGWDQYITDSFFSGVLFRWPREDYGYGEPTLDTDHVICGRFYT